MTIVSAAYSTGTFLIAPASIFICTLPRQTRAIFHCLYHFAFLIKVVVFGLVVPRARGLSWTFRHDTTVASFATIRYVTTAVRNTRYRLTAASAIYL